MAVKVAAERAEDGMKAGKKKYRKKIVSDVIAVKFFLETEGFTYRKWGSEQFCKPGDWIVNNDGDVYTVDQESFSLTYTAVSPGVYRKTGSVWAVAAEEDGVIQTKEGQTNYCKGDYLVFNDEAGIDCYAVGRKEFESMYEEILLREHSIVSQPSGIELVRIPGGTFMMGSPEDEKGRDESEGPRHEVTVSDFCMGRYLVTNEEYGRYLEANPDTKEPRYWGDSRYNQSRQPVVGVSWHEARSFCKWSGCRLPSESEWEYACRAGTKTRFHSGDRESDLERVGWYAGNSGGSLHQVGEKEPNDFGLYDMHGNVWEWCEDDWHEGYEGAPVDGSVWVGEDRRRVLRGGAFYLNPGFARAASRLGNFPYYGYFSIGFRVVSSPFRL